MASIQSKMLDMLGFWEGVMWWLFHPSAECDARVSLIRLGVPIEALSRRGRLGLFASGHGRIRQQQKQNKKRYILFNSQDDMM